MCGTIMAAILEDDDSLPRILSCSIYATSTVHIFITVSENITYTTKKENM